MIPVKKPMTLREVRALAFRLAPSGLNRSPKTGRRPTRAELAELADLLLRVDLDSPHDFSETGG